MAGQDRPDSRELGLELGRLALRYFAGTEELHYGLWDEDLPVSMQNLAEAQRRYTRQLLDWVPAQDRRVLDVGCGTGIVAEALLARGHEVECVSPSEALADRAQARLGPDVPVHRCRFEDFRADRPFDLVLFSESFQYIPMGQALQRALAVLAPGGHILICDFFKTEAPGRGPMKGGHRYRRLRPALAEQGLTIEAETDLTDRVAPTLTLHQQMSEELLQPAAELIGDYTWRRWPWRAALLRRLFRKRLARIRRKHLSGERNAEAFRHWKTYRLLLIARAADQSA